MSLNFEKQITNSVLRALLASMVAIIVKVIQLVIYHEDSTGLLKPALMSYIMEAIVVALVVYAIFEYYMLSLKFKKLAGFVKPAVNPFIGLIIVMVGVCFLFQGVMDGITVLTTHDASILSKIVVALTLITSVDFFILGFEIINESKRKHFIHNIIPVLWSVAVLMNVIVTYPITVSIQSNISKVLCCVLLVLFTYSMLKPCCDYNKKYSSFSEVFFKISFSGLTLIFVLPYCIVYFFGIKDSIVNVPYVALLGLTLYGFMTLAQYMALSLNKIEKENKYKM